MKFSIATIGVVTVLFVGLSVQTAPARDLEDTAKFTVALLRCSLALDWDNAQVKDLAAEHWESPRAWLADIKEAARRGLIVKHARDDGVTDLCGPVGTLADIFRVQSLSEVELESGGEVFGAMLGSTLLSDETIGGLMSGALMEVDEKNVPLSWKSVNLNEALNVDNFGALFDSPAERPEQLQWERPKEFVNAVPDFTLPPPPGRDQSFETSHLLGGGRKLVHFFGSSCEACRGDYAFLSELARTEGVPIYGIAYRDTPEDVSQWLEENGDPYVMVGVDVDGRVGIEWGLYGLPETLVVDEDGIIVKRRAGVLNQKIVADFILPIVKRSKVATE